MVEMGGTRAGKKVSQGRNEMRRKLDGLAGG